LHCQWDPVIPFAGARLVQRFDIQVESSSRFYWSDALMAGRARRDEHWQFDSLAHELHLEVDGALCYLERYRLEPRAQSPAAAWRTGLARYLGTAIVHHDAATTEDADRLHRSVEAPAGLSAAVDLVEPRLIVGRFLAESGTAFARARARFRTETLDHIFQAPHLVFRR
jgi:urease accessory protein UreH